MSEKAVKLMRCPVDTSCGNPECKKDLPFGVWVYYNALESAAICIACAIERGWTPKQRVKQLMKALELREDIKVLRMQKKIEMNALVLLKQTINVHRLGERDLHLERQIVACMDTVQGYMQKIATPEEKEALNRVFEVIRETQELQKEVREHVHDHVFLIERREKRKNKAKGKPSPRVFS